MVFDERVDARLPTRRFPRRRDNEPCWCLPTPAFPSGRTPPPAYLAMAARCSAVSSNKTADRVRADRVRFVPFAPLERVVGDVTGLAVTETDAHCFDDSACSQSPGQVEYTCIVELWLTLANHLKNISFSAPAFASLLCSSHPQLSGGCDGLQPMGRRPVPYLWLLAPAALVLSPATSAPFLALRSCPL